MTKMSLFCALLVLGLALGQEKPVPLSKQKVEARIRELGDEYQQLQRLVDDPQLAVPNWRARMRQIEGLVEGLRQSIQDSTLLVPADLLKAKTGEK